MAKKLADIIAFKLPARVVQFPLTKLCGCGCGTLLNMSEDAFIISEETGQWYMDETDFLKALDVVERNGRYRYKTTEYWYSKSEFYEELQAYWMNEFAPIA